MASKNQMNQVIAGAGRDPFHAVFMGMLRPQDTTLATRGQGKGLWIYDEIERDCHAYSVLQKRKFAVVSFPWDVEPASQRLKDRQAAKTVKAKLEAMPFDALRVGLLDAILKGYAVGEVIWNPQTWDPIDVVMREQRRFMFDLDGQPRLLTRDNMFPGEELPDRKFIVHRFGSKVGDPYGLGLGSKLFWPVFFKRQGLTFWLVFAEKFGSPTAIGKYSPEMPQDKQDLLLDTLSSLAQETAIIAPLGTEIDLLEAARSGSVDSYERLIRYMDEEISKATLGETLTTTLGQSGAYAASKTHNEVRLELVRADADMLNATLNRTLVTWITELHCPGAEPPRVTCQVEEQEDLLNESKKDAVIFGMGFEPSEAYIREKYGEGWTRKAAPNPPPPGALIAPAPNQPLNPDGLEPTFAEGTGADPADRIATQVEAAAAGAMTGLLEPVRRLVKSAQSLAEIRDGLLDLYPQMDTAAFAEVLTQAFLASHLAGQVTVRQEAGLPAAAGRQTR